MYEPGSRKQPESRVIIRNAGSNQKCLSSAQHVPRKIRKYYSLNITAYPCKTAQINVYIVCAARALATRRIHSYPNN